VVRDLGDGRSRQEAAIVIRLAGLRPSRIVALGLIFTLAAWTAAAAAESAASPVPTLTVTPAAASVGSTVMVRGQGFPPQVYNLQVAVCGNLGLNGTADCNQTSARTTFTGDGTFALNVPVAMPPTPCPCAILAFAPAIPDLVTVPFTVIGAPVATPATPPPAFEQKTLKVENAKLEGSGDWQSWFGASTTRDLVVTIHNAGTAPVDDPPLVLTAGKGNNPQRVVTPPHVGRVEPGARRTVRAEVPLDPLSFGTYTVRGRIGNTGAQETFRTHATVYPWGLLVGSLLLLLLMLIWLWKVLRRRIAARKARKRATEVEQPDHLDALSEAEGWEEYEDEEGTLAHVDVHWRQPTDVRPDGARR
jgi:hypothetical protein